MPLPHVKALCGVYSRRSGEPCKNPANRWTGRCRMHGGRCYWSGSLNPAYVHGLYCRHDVDLIQSGGTIALFNLWHNPEWSPSLRVRARAWAVLFLAANAPGGFTWAHEIDAKRLERQERERAEKQRAAIDGVVPPRTYRACVRPSWRDRITLFSLPDEGKEKRARCGAMAKGTGEPCRLPVVAFRDRCRWHGGCSTGPKTKEGKEAIAQAQRLRWARYRAAKQVAAERVC